MTGDSVMRQTFFRLVAYIRGFPQHAEIHFHCSVRYHFNTTHDELRVLDAAENFGSMQSHGGAFDEGTFVIDFLWMPFAPITAAEVAFLGSMYLVTTVNYWNSSNFSSIDVRGWARQVYSTTGLRALLWVASPPPMTTENVDHLLRRHEKVRREFRALRQSLESDGREGLRGSKKINVLPN